MVFKGRKPSAGTRWRDGGGISSILPPYPRARSQPLSSPWGCGHAGTPPWPARCRCWRGAPGQEQPILSPAPLPGSDAAEVPGRCCGFIQLTAAAMQERACSSWSLPGAGWSWRAVRVRSELSQQGVVMADPGSGEGGRDTGPCGAPGLRAAAGPPGRLRPGVHLRGQRGACARGVSTPRDLNAAARGCVRRRPWSMQMERRAARRALRSPRAAAPGQLWCGHGGQ